MMIDDRVLKETDVKMLAVLLATALATAASAADDPTPRIIVSGTATAQTPPDRAAISYSIRGEGQTADDAVKALVAKRDAIEAGLGRFRGAAAPTAGQMAVNEMRGRECQGYQPQLSVGACAVLGYRADMEVEVKTSAVKDAGTIVGLIGRLGGTNPRIAGFGLVDDQPARARAMTDAFAEAHKQAEALAAAGHVRLGRLLSASDGSYGGRPEMAGDIVVTASRGAAPPPPPPPIAVDLTPRPIETQARVTVVYEVLP